MSLRTSLILMVVFIGLGYLAIFEPLRTQERDDDKAEHESHVVWLKGKRAESLRVVSEKGTLSFDCVTPKKAGCALDGTGDWMLSAPAKDKADGSAVGTLLSSLLNLTHNGKLDFEHGFDAKEFGLEHPKASVEIKLLGEARPVTLAFGGPSVVGPNSYLSVSGDPNHLFLVPTFLLGVVDQDLFHWRNKRLFPTAESTAVSAIRWTSKKAGELSAERTGETWHLVKPRNVLASKIMFEGLGSTLSYAAGKSIFAESRAAPEAKALLAGAPELAIHFSLNGGGEHDIRLYPNPKAPKLKLALVDDAPTVYAIDGTGFDRFGKDLTDYRQRSVLTDADRSQADELHLEFPREKKTIILQLQHGIWNPTGGDKLPGMVVQARLAGFLDQLRDADYKGFFPAKGASPEAKAWRTETPDLRVEVRAAGKTVASAAFLVHDRTQALTESEGDVRTVGAGPFLKALLVHFTDLLQPANQAVITGGPEGGAHGLSAKPAQLGK